MISSGAKVLITGATGFTGAVLLRALCAAGCDVHAIVRESSDRSAMHDLPVTWHVGEVFDAELIEQAADSVEYAFHVAAAYRQAGISDQTYVDVHITSTQLLAKALAKQPGFKRLIHVSTVGVLGHIENPPADENTAFNPGDIYQDTKTTAEKWIREFAESAGLPVTVIRPAAIFGPGDMRLLKVFKFAKLPVVPILGFSRGLYHLIHVDDLVAFMIHAAGSDSANGEVYICGNPEPTTIRDIVETVGKHLGKTPPFVRLPAWPVFALAYVCEKVCRMIGVEPPLYPRRVAFFTKDRAFNTTKMQSLDNFQYRFSNETGLRSTCDWYRDNGYL